MNKKVYFAGSIRGGRQDAELYKRIITAINKTDTVLTGDDYFEICPYEDEDNLFGAIGYILERN